MTATARIDELKAAGFSDEEVGDWAVGKRKELSQAGFNDGEIDTYFGKPPFDPKPLVKMFNDNHVEAKKPAAEGGEPKPVTSFTEAIEAGWQMSVTGLVARGEAPDKALAADAPRASRIASGAATLAGDLPAMIGGAALAAGGGPVIGAAGAFALPAGLRATLMDAYTKGEFNTFGEFWDRASGIFIDTAKGWLTGAATGGAGAVAGKALAAAAPTARAAGTFGAEVTTMVSVGSALEGHVPNANDFIDAAIMVGGLKGSMKMSAKLRDVYRETGRKPDEVLADVQKDPTVAQDLAATNVAVPRSYAKQAPDFPAKAGVTDLKVAGSELAVKDVVEQGRGSSGFKGKQQGVEDVDYASDSTAKARDDVLGKISVGGHNPKDPLSFERLYTMVIDDLNPIREAVKEASNGKLPTSQDPYQLARLTRGTFGKADQMLEHGTFRFDSYRNNGESLKAILDPVKDDLNAVRAYAAAKRSLELDGRGIKSGIDLAAAKEVVNSAGVKYEPILKGMVDYQNRLAEYLKDSGVISDKALEAMKAANKDYVPFFRVLDGGEVGGTTSGRGLTTKDPVKKIKGSERVIVDPIESIIKNTYLYISLAERNAVGAKFIEMANKSGRPEDFYVPSESSESTVLATAPGTSIALKATTPVDHATAEFLRQHGLSEAAPELGEFVSAAKSVTGADEIAVFTNGKRKLYKVDPEVAKAFKAADSETVGILTKILAVPAQTLRAGSVLSPDFMMRNLVRDQSSAFVLSKAGYLPVFDMVKGAMSIAKRDEHFQNWLKSGGANSALVAVDRRYLQEHIFKLSGDTGLASRAWNVAKSPLEILRISSELIEDSTRLGEFRRAAGTDTSKANIQAAGMASREVTLDFARIGSKMRAMNMISAFLNAHVQGLDRTVRAFKENPVASTVKTGASITLPSILLYMANKDDHRWNEIPRWQKDLFWIIMTDEHVYRIPKPFELGIIFGSIPERVMESYFNDNPDAFKDMENTISQAFLPNMIPTAAAPVIEQFSNRSLFSGNPLIPSHMEGILPEYQYNDYTTETTKALGALIGSFPGLKKKSISDEDTLIGGTARALTTPVLIENYLRAWSGGLGVYALQIADKGLRESGVLPDPEKPAATLADIPVIKAFVVRYPSGTAQSIQDFYDTYSERKKSFETIRRKAAEGDVEAVEKTMAFDKNAMVQLDGVKETLTEHSKLIRLIHKNPDIPGDEKRQIIDTLYFRMIELSKAANEELNSLPN
ncbi:LPD38 domain-containing protein [Nitrosovibrio sp. Nv4]|uniref:LPD38 domain-containing protein n=1 Tax=Nitrosovibrio sp. Nv4 TaxID=1945880 RepID=UPI000BC3A4EB|nr:LPD38 domain-containing protein [Nitrosovibrio sp. Nv4]SOD41311.1 hypothetical protein SAMN06298226_1606 [Nitrosovibrio sp. Nv4]